MQLHENTKHTMLKQVSGVAMCYPTKSESSTELNVPESKSGVGILRRTKTSSPYATKDTGGVKAYD